MSEIIKKKPKGEDYFLDNLNRKFLLIESFDDFTEINSEIELCILKTNFKNSDLKFIKKLKIKNPNTEFWILSDNLSRENILIANKYGIKNVISSPFDKKMVEEFFNNKSGNYCEYEPKKDKYDYSCIANSKIMIVDDNMMNIELLREILNPFNVEISTFQKPKEAYKTSLHEEFDLFLLDIMMPEMSGFELAKKIKNTHTNKNSDIIFISALSDSHTKITGYDLGSCAYIEKPFDINIVKSQIFNLLKTRKAAEILKETRENFLASVAHDLKTPISAEINALNLLLGKNFGELEGEQEELIEDILHSTKFMQDMVENILCKNKIENNKIVLSKQVYSLKEIIEHCIEQTKHIIKPKQQKIELEYDRETILIPLDFLEIKRALINLIANASEYSPIGGKIEIKVYKNGSKVCLSVKDFGKGIEVENQKDVFSQYITYAKKYKKVGTGLGLFITKNIIEAHDGEIILESKIGQGTKVTIMLPIYDKE